jgi:hypothetical protein
MSDEDKRESRQDDTPTRGEEIGEAAGSISGVLLGAGIGSAAGPVGALIGGVAGALGGWWAGKAVAESAAKLSREDEDYFREHYESYPNRPADRSYDDVRAVYYLGHIASQNPNFLERTWTEVEPELERGWTLREPSSWRGVRDYAEVGYSRGRARLDEGKVVERRQGGMGEDVERRE